MQRDEIPSLSICAASLCFDIGAINYCLTSPSLSNEKKQNEKKTKSFDSIKKYANQVITIEL